MAKTATYSLIQSQTISSSTASVTFSSIPQTFTDLILVTRTFRSAAAVMKINFNGDTATNYSEGHMQGDGTNDSCAGNSNIAYGIIDYASQTTTPVMSVVNFLDYSNTTTFKTFLSRSGDSTNNVIAYVNLWRSSAAISSIVLALFSGTISADSTFKLYGIEAYT